MSVNKYLPHVLVLPEDDANRQLANGFILTLRGSKQIQILPEAGGWEKALDRFLAQYARSMESLPGRSVVLLIDFDGQLDRYAHIRGKIPAAVVDRVFILGVSTEPEDLKHDLGPFESIGRAIGRDCAARH